MRSAQASRTLSHFGRKRTGAGVVGVRQGCARDVEELAALLVAEAAQRLEQLQRSVDLGHAHHAPGPDVAARRGAECREVAAEDLGARLDRDVRLRFLDRDEPSLVARLPERRLVVVDDVRCDARHLPGAARIDAGEAVLALQVGERLCRRDGPPGCERAHRRGELLRPFRLPGEVRLAHGRPDERIVAPRDEVQRLPHRGRPDDRGLPEQALERPAPEPRRARPDADVRSLRRLRLHPDEALDHRRRRESRALEEELPRECRAVQLA